VCSSDLADNDFTVLPATCFQDAATENLTRRAK